MAGFTEDIGVGWVVSPVISLIVEKTQTYISNNYFKKVGIELEMTKMKTNLTEILLIMRTVEKLRIEDRDQLALLQGIKDVVYDAEDIMDAIEYNILKKKSEKLQEKTVSRISSSSAHAIHNFIVGNGKFKKKVKEVGKSLDRAKVSANTLLRLMEVHISQNDECKNCSDTSSHISDVIIGRVDECQLLIDLLLKENESPSPTIIPIVGQGGIGKTTIAQMVFNDKKLEGKFDKKVWVTVSNNFNKVRLTKEILKHVSVEFAILGVNINKLQEELGKIIASKKVLLVFDDVWYDRNESAQFGYNNEWLEVISSLRKARKESKIILTTRMPIVKSILGTCTFSPISVDGLSEKDSWSLFEMCAFNGRNQNKQKELESVGKVIVNKLKGSPLAIRALGTQLRGNSDMEEWRRVLNDTSSDTSDIMKILHRCYEHLPTHLKRCFAYCSLFPKYYHFKCDRLAHMWIAQGFIHSEERKNLEDVAKSYFKALLARSFFQFIKHGRKEYYVMHDLVNDLACLVSKPECHILNKGDSIKNLGSIRHLSVTFETLNTLMNMHDLEKLRTLICLRDILWDEEVDLSNLLIKLKRIRVLHIEWKPSILCDIGECNHLRYLSFRLFYYDIKILDSLEKLHQLTALFLKKNSYSRSRIATPDRLQMHKWSTSSLIVFYVSKLITVQVGGLTQIKTHLRGPACLRVEKKDRHRLDQLEDMNNIKGFLEITRLENVTSKIEAVKAQLNKKEHVTELSLEWENSSSKIESSLYHEVLEALSPNLNLRKLNIKGYIGVTWASWLESNLLSAIKSINLFHCERIKMLPALGQLPLLQELYIKELTAVRRIGLEFYGKGMFPNLETLVIDRLSCLDEWSYPCDTLVFPKLHTLKIMYCPMFTVSELNEFPALQYLQIYGGPVSNNKKIKALFQGHISLLSLTKLEIDSCHVLTKYGGLLDLVSLQTLYINNCPNLLCLPEMEFFYSLKFLAIIDCPKLRSLSKNGLPVSLQLLIIGGTKHFSLEEQIRNKKGTEWDKVAAISGCQLFSSVVNQWYDDSSRVASFNYESPIGERGLHSYEALMGDKYDLGPEARYLFHFHYESLIEDNCDYSKIQRFKVNKDADTRYSS